MTEWQHTVGHYGLLVAFVTLYALLCVICIYVFVGLLSFSVQAFPISFRDFDIWKLPLHMYLAIVFIGPIAVCGFVSAFFLLQAPFFLMKFQAYLLENY